METQVTARERPATSRGTLSGGSPGRVVGMSRQDGGPHVDPDLRHPPLFGEDLEREDAAAGLDAQFLLPRDAVVVDVLGHAADAVAAHFRLAAVGIEHPHAGVGSFAGADEDQAVSADAEMAVGDDAGQGGEVVGQPLRERVHVHVVVAGAVHLGEAHVRRVHEVQGSEEPADQTPEEGRRWGLVSGGGGLYARNSSGFSPGNG
jgi:hypothetical protein